MLFPKREQCHTVYVRIIARSTLVRFIAKERGQRALKSALDAWFHEAQKAQRGSSADVKRDYGTASIFSSDRVVFNIKGDDYRLVTAIGYERQIVIIKWVGSHEEYNNIHARTVAYGD
jgi:mRNA interferase HigB